MRAAKIGTVRRMRASEEPPDPRFAVRGMPAGWRPRAGLVLAIWLVLAAACSDVPPTGADSPDRRAPEAPIELLVANARQTDLTLVLRLTSARSIGRVGDYETYELAADVERVVAGESAESIRYRRTVEVGTWTPRAGEQYLVSFDRSGDELVIPDVGYHFAYDQGTYDALVRALADAP